MDNNAVDVVVLMGSLKSTIIGKILGISRKRYGQNIKHISLRPTSHLF